MKVLDTNIFLRYLIRDNEEKYLRTKELFDRVIDGQEEVMTTVVVVHEVCYVLTASGINFYNWPHAEVRDRVYPLLELESLALKDKTICLAALDIFAQGEKIDVADALAVAYVRAGEADGVYSYDASTLGKIERANRVVPCWSLMNDRCT